MNKTVMRHPSPWALGIDIGTTHVRSMLLDAKGLPITKTTHSRPAPLFSDSTGISIMDPDALLNTVETCILETLTSVQDEKYHVAVVGICSFWHSLVGVDSGGNALFPIITWADTRSEGVVGRIKTEWDEPEMHRRTGCALHSSYYPARLIWLRENYPERFAQVRKWLSPSDYLIFKYLGRCVTSHSMASATGIYQQDTMQWDEEMLSACSLKREHFPEICDAAISSQHLRAPAHALSKLLFGALWCTGIGDGAASNIGCGCVHQGEVAINFGTSGAIRTVWEGERCPSPSQLWRYRINSSLPLLGAAFSDGGADILWAQKVLRLPREMELRGTPFSKKNNHGLRFSPYLSGERSIHWRAGMKGSLSGLTLHTTPEEIFQAILEGTTMQFREAMDIMESSLGKMERITISGGAVDSFPYLANMLADALERPLHRTLQREVSCHGAGIYAMHSIGMLSSMNDVIIEMEIIEPDSSEGIIPWDSPRG